MSAEEIKKDPVIKSIFDEGGLEQPSDNFTDQIINTIKAQSKDSAFVYKPVISKKAWLALTFLGISLFVYLMLGLSPDSEFLGFHGFLMDFDTSGIKKVLGQFRFSLELSPILKMALATLSIFTFANLIIFELRSRSFFK
jgi:hypothetical protein